MFAVTTVRLSGIENGYEVAEPAGPVAIFFDHRVDATGYSTLYNSKMR